LIVYDLPNSQNRLLEQPITCRGELCSGEAL